MRSRSGLRERHGLLESFFELWHKLLPLVRLLMFVAPEGGTLLVYDPDSPTLALFRARYGEAERTDSSERAFWREHSAPLTHLVEMMLVTV